MFISKIKNNNIRDKREKERQAEQIEKQSALLEYVAMMTDVELPEVDEEVDAQ